MSGMKKFPSKGGMSFCWSDNEIKVSPFSNSESELLVIEPSVASSPLTHAIKQSNLGVTRFHLDRGRCKIAGFISSDCHLRKIVSILTIYCV